MKTGSEGEVSTFTLDVYWASGQRGDPALDQHIAGCARCRGYLASLEIVGVPRESRVTRPQVHRERGRARWALPSVVVTTLALVAGVLLFVRTRPPPPDYVGAKGTPAVQLLVHRGAETWIWDGRSAIRPGDALALRVGCEGMDQVAVASREASGWARLQDAACPGGDEPLPFTLVVDDVPGDEGLAVVLSRSPLDEGALREAIGDARRTSEVWVEQFVLPKEMGSER